MAITVTVSKELREMINPAGDNTHGSFVEARIQENLESEGVGI